MSNNINIVCSFNGRLAIKENNEPSYEGDNVRPMIVRKLPTFEEYEIKKMNIIGVYAVGIVFPLAFVVVSIENEDNVRA